MQLLRRLSFTMLLMSLMTLVACGDGDGDLTGGGDVGGTSPDAITLSLAKSGGNSDGHLSGDNDVTIRVTVMQGTSAVANKLVTFELTNNTEANATLSSTSQATDSSGVATITVSATNSIGGVEITASITDIDPVSGSFNSIGGGVVIVPPEGPVADSIRLFASSQQIASSGAQTIILTAIAKDGNNNLLEGVTITFAADSGALGKVLDDDGNSSDITGPDGKVTRKLSTLAEPTNRIITTTVTSGAVSDTLEVKVVGTSVTLTGSSSLALNDANSYIIKVLDSDGTGLANTTVDLTLSGESTDIAAGNVAAITFPASVMTDFNGQATIAVMGTSGGTNSIIATAHGASATQGVTVQADSFLFTNFGDGANNVNPSTSAAPDILLSKIATVTLIWLRSGEPVKDADITVTTTRGNLNDNSLRTDNEGRVKVDVTSTNAGKALITFIGTDTLNGNVIELKNQLEFEFVADRADRLIAQIYPQSIGPNEQTSTVSVVVRDVLGNLVKNKTIDFFLTDTNGGAIFPASAVTDSNGSASTVYTSNSTSAHEGVEIKASVRGTLVTDMVKLTVAERQVFIALGTGNTIKPDEETQTIYTQQYSVFVTDIDSKPVPDVILTVTAIPKQYRKGFWVEVLKDGDFDHYAAYVTATCENEDKNQNGELDAGEDDDPINGNNDGRLTPGNIGSVLGADLDGKTTRELITDEEGRAVIDFVYPESFGAWATIDLIVSTKVRGTESFARALFLLSVAGTDLITQGSPPGSNIPFQSDFGTSINCTNPN